MSGKIKKGKIGCGSVLLILLFVGMFACTTFSFSPSHDLRTFVPEVSIRNKTCISLPTIPGGQYVGQFTENDESFPISGTSLVWRGSAFIKEKVERIEENYVRHPNGYGLWRHTTSNDVEYAYAGQWNKGRAHGKGKYIEYLPDPPFPTRLLTKCEGQFKDGKFVDGTTEGNCSGFLIHVRPRYTNYRYTSQNKPGKCSSCRRWTCSS